MTNYNEKLDEILLTTLREMSRELEAYGYIDSKNYLSEKKQSITSLTKELVAEAKPKYQTFTRDMVSRGEVKQTIDQFEQNLLKALEDV